MRHLVPVASAGLEIGLEVAGKAAITNAQRAGLAVVRGNLLTP